MSQGTSDIRTVSKYVHVVLSHNIYSNLLQAIENKFSKSVRMSLFENKGLISSVVHYICHPLSIAISYYILFW
jgi:hypothetical protein